MLSYIYYAYGSKINKLYFGIACAVIVSSLVTNIVSLNIQISKYDFDVSIYNQDSLNNALNGDHGLISFITRILTVVIFIVTITAVIVFVYMYSEKVRTMLDNYFKKLTFQKFFKDSKLKSQKINEIFLENSLKNEIPITKLK